MLDRNFSSAALLAEADFADVEADDELESPVESIRRAYVEATRFSPKFAIPSAVGSYRNVADIIALEASDFKGAYDLVFVSFKSAADHFAGVVWEGREPGQVVVGIANDQYELPVVGAFAPSSELLKVWKESLALLGAAAGRETAASSDNELAQQFSKSLKGFFGAIGQELRAAGDAYGTVTSGGRFAPQLQIQLCDRFLIVPDQGSLFLSLLSGEIVATIKAGGGISGAWGKLALDPRGDIYFQLSRLELPKRTGFKRAQQIK